MGRQGGTDLWASLTRRGQEYYGTSIWYPVAVILRVFEFILTLPVLGILARIIDDYNLSGKPPGVGYYIWIALGAVRIKQPCSIHSPLMAAQSIASILVCMFFVLAMVEDVPYGISAAFMAADTGLLVIFIYVSVIFLEQIAGISCTRSATDRILNGWSTDVTLTKSFKPDIQALTKTTVAHCVSIKAAFYLTVALSLLYCFSTGFSLGLFWKKFTLKHGSGGRGGKGGQQMYDHGYQNNMYYGSQSS